MPRPSPTRLGARSCARSLLAVIAASALGLLSVGPALGGEQRAVGPYAFEVGFLNEPVFVGDRSGLELHVTNADRPVDGLDRTLKAEAIVGEATRDLPLTERENQPGWYESVFIPTVAGAYTFHITGTIEGTAVDESFTSSPTGFDQVQEATAAQFPVTMPTTAELADQARQGSDAAAQLPIALALGGAGLLAGLLGLGVSLGARRRPKA